VDGVFVEGRTSRWCVGILYGISSERQSASSMSCNNASFNSSSISFRISSVTICQCKQSQSSGFPRQQHSHQVAAGLCRFFDMMPQQWQGCSQVFAPPLRLVIFQVVERSASIMTFIGLKLPMPLRLMASFKNENIGLKCKYICFSVQCEFAKENK
jgi:hypothetical protein